MASCWSRWRPLALVVAAAAPVRNPVERVLALAPLRALGTISYGVYLWHWPIYVMLTPARTGLEGTALWPCGWP